MVKHILAYGNGCIIGKDCFNCPVPKCIYEYKSVPSHRSWLGWYKAMAEGHGANDKCILYRAKYCAGDCKGWSDSSDANKDKCEKCSRKLIT